MDHLAIFGNFTSNDMGVHRSHTGRQGIYYRLYAVQKKITINFFTFIAATEKHTCGCSWSVYRWSKKVSHLFFATICSQI